MTFPCPSILRIDTVAAICRSLSVGVAFLGETFLLAFAFMAFIGVCWGSTIVLPFAFMAFIGVYCGSRIGFPFASRPALLQAAPFCDPGLADTGPNAVARASIASSSLSDSLEILRCDFRRGDLESRVGVDGGWGLWYPVCRDRIRGCTWGIFGQTPHPLEQFGRHFVKQIP